MRLSSDPDRSARRIRALGVLIALGLVMSSLAAFAAASAAEHASPALPPEEEPAARPLVLPEPPCTEIVEEAYTEVIPYITVTIYDDTMYSDESTVLREGRDGVRTGTLVTSYIDGTAYCAYTKDVTAVCAPEAEIIVVGSIPGSRYDSRGYYIWPTTGKISSGFGGRNVSVGSSNHKGLDIANKTGTDVCAADSGTVIYAGFLDGSGYGNVVKIEHDNGDLTYYAHLSQILVSAGDRVCQGQLIARMGATGNVTGPHLHFELRPSGGNPVDPASHLTGELQQG